LGSLGDQLAVGLTECLDASSKLSLRVGAAVCFEVGAQLVGDVEGWGSALCVEVGLRLHGSFALRLYARRRCFTLALTFALDRGVGACRARGPCSTGAATLRRRIGALTLAFAAAGTARV